LAEVIIQDGETLENALRRFKRKVQQSDIIKEIKKHSYYMKPGEKKRAKKALAEVTTGQVLKILSTDPGSVKDFAAFAKQTGNELLSTAEAGGEFTFFMKKK